MVLHTLQTGSVESRQKFCGNGQHEREVRLFKMPPCPAESYYSMDGTYIEVAELCRTHCDGRLRLGSKAEMPVI